jgi:hypothetical protein
MAMRPCMTPASDLGTHLCKTLSSASLAIVRLDKLLLVGEFLPLPSNAILVGDVPDDSLRMCGGVGGEADLKLPAAEGENVIDCRCEPPDAVGGVTGALGPREIRGPRGCPGRWPRPSGGLGTGEELREPLPPLAGDWLPERVSSASATLSGVPAGAAAAMVGLCSASSAGGSTNLGSGGGDGTSRGSLKSGRGGAVGSSGSGRGSLKDGRGGRSMSSAGTGLKARWLAEGG